jgi:TRAP-type mannitol/chloroaromatic compound transport system permease small subunit
MKIYNDWDFSRIIVWLSRKTANFSGFLIIFMMLTIVVDVFGRYVFNRPLVGGVELNRTLLVIIVFFGLAFTQLNQGHIRVDLLLIRASPKWGLILEAFALMIAIPVYGIVAFATIPVTIQSIVIGEYETGLIPFPIWPSRLFMSVGMFLFTFQLVADLIVTISSKNTRSLKDRNRKKEEDPAPHLFE